MAVLSPRAVLAYLCALKLEGPDAQIEAGLPVGCAVPNLRAEQTFDVTPVAFFDVAGFVREPAEQKDFQVRRQLFSGVVGLAFGHRDVHNPEVIARFRPLDLPVFCCCSPAGVL